MQPGRLPSTLKLPRSGKLQQLEQQLLRLHKHLQQMTHPEIKLAGCTAMLDAEQGMQQREQGCLGSLCNQIKAGETEAVSNINLKMQRSQDRPPHRTLDHWAYAPHLSSLWGQAFRW